MYCGIAVERITVRRRRAAIAWLSSALAESRCDRLVVVDAPGGTETERAKAALISAGIVCAALVFYFFRWDSAAELARAVDHGESLFLDFERYYYPVGEKLLTDPTPPRGYLYSAFFALVLTLFACGSLPVALWLWGLFQSLLVVVTLAIPARHLSSFSTSALYLYVALVATSFPYLHNFVWGQVSVLLLATVLGALYLYRAGRKDLSSIVLALGASVKLYTIVLVVYFVLKREWRYLAVFVMVFFSATLLLPVAVLGSNETISFYRDIGVVLRDAQTIFLRDVNSQSFVSVAYRGLRHAMSPEQVVYLRAAGLAVFATSCFGVWRLVESRARDDTLWSFALILLSMPFVVGSSWPHYFVYLPYVQAFFVADLLGKGSSPRRTTVFLLVLLPSILMGSSLFFLKIGQWYEYSSGNYLFVSNALLLLYAWTKTLRPRPTAPTLPPQG
jgi:hypothetical protein